MKQNCWKKAREVPGRDPRRWRLDAVGNVVCKKLTSCEGCLCHEYDHIVPFSKGGLTEIDNCQILATRVNRMKANQENDESQLKLYGCVYEFSERELDVIEMAVYGNVNRVGNSCRCKSLIEFQRMTKYKDKMECT